MTTTSNLHRLVPALLLALLSACGSGSSSSSSSSGGECTKGMLGCGCIDGTACWPGSTWACIDGVCKEPSCEVGNEGCACYSNNTCNADTTGNAMRCRNGTCEKVTCETGTLNCECTSDGTCTGSDLACTPVGDGTACTRRDCAVGAMGCPCGEGRACNAGLACAQNTCVSSSCRPGSNDCYCKADRSCDSGLQCNSEDRCETIPCTAGSLGCRCDDGQCTATGAYCDSSNTCQQAQCLAGTEGCPCQNGTTCGAAEDGARLFCESTRCRREACAPGSLACACRDGYICDGQANCVDGTCIARGCTPGSANCTCAAEACQYGLRCREDNVCVDATGYVSGPCGANNACNRGGTCNSGICVQCTLGVPGCACNDANGCFAGAVCISGMCVAEADVPPALPSVLNCYTPCEENLVEGDAGLRVCGADGLMSGCVGGRTCREGSCLLPTEAVPTCRSEFDCPSFQTCIGGKCYSECDQYQGCATGKVCDDHVCRVPCTATGTACGSGQFCDSNDGVNGVCKPAKPGSTTSTTIPTGNFSLSIPLLAGTTEIAFNNNKISGSFNIQNDSPTYQSFLIRKATHRVTMANGDTSTAARSQDGLVRGCDGGTCMCTDDDDCYSGYACKEGACRATGCTASTCPLFWLSLAEGLGTPTQVDEMTVGVEAGEKVTIKVGNASGYSAVRWDGRLDVISKLGTQAITVSYSEVPEGQWAGKMVYLSNFNTTGLDAWVADKTNATKQSQVANALVQRWIAFRKGALTLDQFTAVLTATQTGSWAFPNVMAACLATFGSRSDACFLYDGNQSGVISYSDDLAAAPIPTGVVELPFAMNLRVPGSTVTQMTGRIESSKALQYPGNPGVTMDFDVDPSGCSTNTGGTCKVFLRNLNASVFIGGRYLTTPSDTECATWRPNQSYKQVKEPWLLPGFTKNTSYDTTTGQRYRYECRDTLLPWQSTDQTVMDGYKPTNRSLTFGNPIPDARARRRTFKLIDGALINQSEMIVLFEEQFSSFLGSDDTQGFSAYGFMRLRRSSADLDPATAAGDPTVQDAFEGASTTDTRTEPTTVLAPQCSRDILTTILGSSTATLSSTNVAGAVNTLLSGVSTSSGAAILDGSTQDEDVHYFCEQTGYFDGGPNNKTSHWLTSNTIPNNDSCTGFTGNGRCEDGGPNSVNNICNLGTDWTDCDKKTRTVDDQDLRIECPAGSNVEFFTVRRSQMSQSDIGNLPCQQTSPGTCGATLKQWKDTNRYVIQTPPKYRCKSSTEVYCDDNRFDLRDGKSFYAEQTSPTTGAKFSDLTMLTEDAFRYVSRFQNRSTGATPGFAPTVCPDNSATTPYCYSPTQIEEIMARVDCLLYIHKNHYSQLNDINDTTKRDARIALDNYLSRNFSYGQQTVSGSPVIHDGFERQLAQLLIMMGDESFTKAFASRFDLAGSNNASFEGSLFEDDGINLSGAAGFEMYSLYQATQYYQSVLDRFFTHAPLLWSVSKKTAPENFITAKVVTYYVDKVIRASTQKARAWGEISKRYQAFNKTDLAREVAERAYSSAYLESIIINRFMLQVMSAVGNADRPQIEKASEDAQRRYRSALLDMQDVFTSIRDGTTIFGFAPEYIPFVALDREDYRQSNAFEVILLRARTKLQFAKEKEDVALNTTREFETDAAQFQSELTQIRNNYEGQLAELCGSFEKDERIYPAIEKYAYLNPTATLLGDPCGLMRSGQIHNQMAAFDDLQVEARQLQVQYDNIFKEAEIERSTVAAQCNEILDLAQAQYEVRGEVRNVQAGIRSAQLVSARINSYQGALSTVAQLAKCEPPGLTSVGDCPTGLASMSGYLTAFTAAEASIAVIEAGIGAAEFYIDDLERTSLKWQTENECDIAKIQSAGRVKTILLRAAELELEFLQLEYRSRQAIAELERLQNQAKRLQMEQKDAEQMAINIQAAHNDPNIRIYRNDAIINAEISFQDALREAYKLTRVYEYYTSQSYAHLNDLFLVRMIARGDKNLENYLNEIEQSFYDFEELFGQPATRVMLVSLRDDMLRIPYVDENGKAIADGTRTEMMREKLADPAMLDKNGYLTIPFQTRLDRVSPLTRNHKVLYIQADIYGNDSGDYLARVYVRQKGTSTVHTVGGDKSYYRFDPRTSVINAKLGGGEYFDPTIYSNYRMREMPLINTNWELIFNQRDEYVNQDVVLSALTDIKLYIYYQDFTFF